MLITYLRSSSFNQWDFCQQQYFLNYVMGLPRKNTVKTVKGTVVHRVLECLANIKKSAQDGNYHYVEEDLALNMKFTADEMYKPYQLTNSEVDKINRTRVNKYNYKHPCKLEYGHVREGVDMVEFLIETCYNYYKAKEPDLEWKPVDFKDCTNWAWMATEAQNGMFDPRHREVIEAEPHFQIELDRPWAKYELDLPDGRTIDGNLTLKGTIDLVTRVDDNTVEIIDWKGLPLETKLPTPNGWSTMGDIQVGDTVFDQYGKRCNVIGKSQVKYKDCYKITFDDTTQVICDDEHLWKLANGTTVSVQELVVGDTINVCKPIDCDRIELPIDPYVLGIWLGDGRKKNGEISSSDPFVYEEIGRRGHRVGDNINKSGSCPSRTVFGLQTELRKLNLLFNKHIPEIYLRASMSQRLDLLRGLMDSDGNVNSHRKQAVFTTCDENISNQVKELLVSLGQRPNQCKTKQSGFGLTVDAYPIHFRPININPFLLPRKKDLILESWGTGLSHRRLIKSIEKIDKTHTQCIMVDSTDHTYLCTENMIPTHNTGQRLDWATGETKTYSKLMKDFQLMLYYYAARQLYPDVESIILTIFFVRDGGPFTVCFDDYHIAEVEKRVCGRYSEILNCVLPKMIDPTQQNFKCNKICDYYKMKSPCGTTNMCKFIHQELHGRTMEEVVQLYRNPHFNIDEYSSPGE